jgi:H+/Cl- antiporter ClcA
MKHGHHIGNAVRREFGDWRRWWARTLVVVASVAAGLTVLGFTWLCESTLTLFFKMSAALASAPLLWTPACTMAIVWVTRRYFAGAAGSGIPQVMAGLDPAVTSQNRSVFVSVRLSLAKICLTAWGLLAGLSLGREGPSVQIAAGIMLAARRWLPQRSGVSAHGLLVAGGAAGIAAAFNAPLAGVMFAIEELSRTPEQRNSGLLVASIVLAGVVAQSIHGNASYFGVIHASEVGLSLMWPGLLVALVCGVAGGVFSRLLVVSLSGNGRDVLSRSRRRHPVLFAGFCGLVVAVLGLLTAGATFGSGYAATHALVDGVGNMPAAYPWFRLLATWLTAWSGVPAGIFAPALAVGAGIGNDIALLTNHVNTPALIALGMVGFLAATTQAPLTSFIIVMEMVDGHAMVLSLMACALVASAIARLIGQPLYSQLAQMQLLRLTPPQSAPAPAGIPASA